MQFPIKNKPIQQAITNNQKRTTSFIQSRSADTKIPYLLFLSIAIAAAGIGLYHYFTGANAMVHWVTVPHLQPVDALIDQFSVAQQAFSIKANGYILTERYDASLPQINLGAARILMGLLGISLVFFLSAGSTLKKIPFLVAMTLLIFFLVNCNIIGLNDTSPLGDFMGVLIMALLILPAYAFHAFFPGVPFSKRVLAFTVLVGLAGLIIYQFSSYSATVTTLHFINYSAPALVVASLLFMGWVAIEIVHILVWFNTQAKSPERRFGLWQFMLISFLYLGNLLMLFLEESLVLTLGLVYLDAFIILFFSAIAGFWGLRKREEIYGNILNFWPGAAFLFLVFATLTFGTVGYAFATANDPLIAALNSLIIYTHLAFGFVFFLYVMINFGRLLGQKLQIYKVIYDPKKLGFYTVYLLGSIGLLTMFYYTNGFVYKQVKAGYFNLLGDLYKTSNEELLAQRFYQESDVFEHSNVKANFSLAGISREKNFRSTEIVYLKEALKRRPNPKIYARLASLFDEKPYFFEQQYTLKDGLGKFPESPMLLNNMALLYNKTSLTDSTLYYYNLAEAQSQEKKVIQSNKLAFFIKNGLPKEAQEIADASAKTDYIPLQSNTVLLHHLVGKETPKPSLPASNTKFTAGTFSLLYHSILNRLHTPDSSAIASLNSYIQTKENELFSEDFKLLKGALQFYNAQPLHARATLENLALMSAEGAGYYQDILGQWFLKQEQYRLAASYFGKAAGNKYPDAALHEAWALALAGRKAEALTIVQQIIPSENKEQAEDAKKLLAVLNANPEQAFSLTEVAKVQFIHVQPLAEKLELGGLVSTIKDQGLKIAAENAVLNRYLKQNDLLAFGQYTETLKNGSKNAIETLERNRLRCQFWVKANNIKALKENLLNLKFKPGFEAEKTYYQAIIAASEKRDTEAKKLFGLTVKMLPYNEDALLAAAKFYRTQLKDDLKAYEVLITGITYNPFSPELHKAYVLQSLKAGFESYAQAGMEQLEPLLSPEEYVTFKRLYEGELAKYQAAAQGWE